jgi:hypothetical protein
MYAACGTWLPQLPAISSQLLTLPAVVVSPSLPNRHAAPASTVVINSSVVLSAVPATTLLPPQPQYECDANGNCKPGDKWPYGMCSLKKLANADKPEFWSNNPGEWGQGVSAWGSVYSCNC